MSGILPFDESYFVVTFFGEVPQSTLIHGWKNVLDHIDKEMGEDDMPSEHSVHGPCCELHDEDNWTSLSSTYRTDDQRHTFSKSEFGYCVGLQITRLTEKPQPLPM